MWVQLNRARQEHSAFLPDVSVSESKARMILVQIFPVSLAFHIRALYIFFLLLNQGIKEDPEYGLVDGGGDYDTVTGYSNGFPHMLALGLQLNHPNLHNKAESLVTSCFGGDWGVARF